jgi:hypothetical protein
MSTQDEILSGNQYVSDNRQEGEQTLKEEATGTHINENWTGESTSPVRIPHHRSCCCISCWSKKLFSYL